MFDRVRVRTLVVTMVVVLAAGACAKSDSGGGGGGGGGADTDATIVWGSTDQPVSFDPAGAYDLPSYNVIYNVYNGLMKMDPGGGVPVPDLAESCDFDDP